MSDDASPPVQDENGAHWLRQHLTALRRARAAAAVGVTTLDEILSSPGTAGADTKELEKKIDLVVEQFQTARELLGAHSSPEDDVLGALPETIEQATRSVIIEGRTLTSEMFALAQVIAASLRSTIELHPESAASVSVALLKELIELGASVSRVVDDVVRQLPSQVINNNVLITPS